MKTTVYKTKQTVTAVADQLTLLLDFGEDDETRLEIHDPAGYTRDGSQLADGILYRRRPFTTKEDYDAAIVEIVAALTEAGYIGLEWHEHAVIYDAEWLERPYEGDGGRRLYWVIVSVQTSPGQGRLFAEWVDYK